MEMNLQLHHVVSNITGVTGMRIIRALVAGERDLDILASYRDVRCHSSLETIRVALVGNDRAGHVFALAQSLDLYDTYQAKIAERDGRSEAAVNALTVRAKSLTPLPKSRFRQKMAGAPAFDVRAALHGVLGIDLTQIHGIGPSLALKLVAACGSDPTAWSSAKHFTSWLCPAPGNKISGGKLLSSRTRRSSSRAAALLRLAAVTVGRSDTALGAFYRRLSSRAGKQKAVTANALEIAGLLYNNLRFGMAYRNPGGASYDARHCARVLTNLQCRARSLLRSGKKATAPVFDSPPTTVGIEPMDRRARQITVKAGPGKADLLAGQLSCIRIGRSRQASLPVL